MFCLEFLLCISANLINLRKRFHPFMLMICIPSRSFFDYSAVEAAIRLILDSTKEREQKPKRDKPTALVGYSKYVRKLFGADNIIFSPEFRVN